MYGKDYSRQWCLANVVFVFVAGLLLGIKRSQAQNLECYECAYFDGTSTDGTLYNTLLTLQSVNEGPCSTGANFTLVSTVNCWRKALPPGYNSWRCYKGDGSFTFGISNGASSNVRYLTRGCAPVKDGDPYSQDTCVDASNTTSYYTQSAIRGLQNFGSNIYISNYGGQHCLCNNPRSPDFVTSFPCNGGIQASFRPTNQVYCRLCMMLILTWFCTACSILTQ